MADDKESESGLQQVTPGYVAGVLQRYPAQRPNMVALIETKYGSHFMRRVLSHSTFTEEPTEEHRVVHEPLPKPEGLDDV
jgi:hypothetical protein